MNFLHPGSSRLVSIFEYVINEYHVTDEVAANMPTWNFETSLELLLAEKCWVDTVQWHLEDVIRDPAINPEEALNIKRQIDASNQLRTNLVEQLDDLILKPYLHLLSDTSLPINTESPAWAIDRLSILCLKIYHMREESERQNAMEAHRKKCQDRLAILLDQKIDLCLALDLLLGDLEAGKRRVKIYRQMKMYNDQELNPVLYKKDGAV